MYNNIHLQLSACLNLSDLMTAIYVSLEKKRTNIAKGVYLRPLCKVCPRICQRKSRGKISPAFTLYF